jgi:hypothetical protein
VPKKKRPARTTKLEEYRLRGNRKGAVLKEQTWLENGKIVAYSLVYINLNRCFVDNGRVLGYDNRHGYHHRHCMGKIEPIVFSNYESLARRFYKEVRELWRKEDEEE